MSRPVKYLCFFLVVVVFAAAVTGIALWTAQYDPDAPDPGFFVKGKKIETPEVMMTVGDHAVSFGLYRHYYLLNKSFYESYYGNTFFADDPDGEKVQVLRDSVEVELLNLYAYLAIAQEYGYTLTDEEKAEIAATLQEQKETLGSNFDKNLKNEMFFLSEEDYISITEMQKLSEKARTQFQEMLREQNSDSVGEEADADFEENYISAKHILIMFDAEETDTEKATADALEKANELYAQLMAEPADTRLELFDELMNEHSEDTGLANNPDGYTFTDGEMVESFYEGALALEIDGISEPIESEYGYHIILRVPLSEEEKEANRESKINAKVSELQNEKVEAIKEALVVTSSDSLLNMRVNDIH